MGYFPNGTAGDCYEHEYCFNCIHYGPQDGPGCPIMLAHILHNYEECNNEKSILHLLIPMDEQGFNKKCLMFVESAKAFKGTLSPHLKEWAKKQGIVEVK
jgi:hypothetical protein